MMIPSIGLASGLGGNNIGCGEGPLFIKKQNLQILDWQNMIHSESKSKQNVELISLLNQQLAVVSEYLTKISPFFFSFGGDHSSALGTWSGVAKALRDEGDLGLIWIDAHMDSHTHETSDSGNVHGMPLAALLGYGDSLLTQISDPFPKVKPENVVLIGIRSHEIAEEELLQKLGVKVYFIEEVKQRGLRPIMEEAIDLVSKNTAGYGVSFDFDSIDPSAVSAVGTPVANGIDAEEMLSVLCAFKKKFPIALELVEYNPSLDPELQTLFFVKKLLSAFHDLYKEQFSCLV